MTTEHEPPERADTERESRMRAWWVEQIGCNDEDVPFLLRRLDAAGLALSTAQTDLANAREDVVRLTEIVEAGRSEDRVKRITAALYRIPTKTEADAGAVIEASDVLLFQSREIAKLRASPSANTMESAQSIWQTAKGEAENEGAAAGWSQHTIESVTWQKRFYYTDCVIGAAKARSRAEAIEDVVCWIEEHVTAPRLGELPAALRALAYKKAGR